MRVQLKGLASATKRLANGKSQTYFYAWRGGPRLCGKLGDLDFIASYNAAVASRQRPASGTFRHVIEMYKNSTEFGKLAARSRSDYLQQISKIELRFGSMPITAIEDRRSRGTFKTWRDELSARSSRQADYAWSVLARILSVAKDRGLISVNHCEKGGRIYSADRAEKIWTAENIRQFCAVASKELQAALLLALWTGQRQGDLLRLSWNGYDGAHIRLRQGKTKKRVSIRVGATLKIALESAKACRALATTVLTNSRGKPWTSAGFRASWGKAFKKSGLADDLHFHDLRGTAVTRLALAECTVPQIAAITGHSLKDVEAILGTHYLGGTVELAEAAIIKLDAVYG